MIILTRTEAIAKLRQGKVIGFLGISGVEIFLSEGVYLFKHRDGELEKLNQKTMQSLDGYYVLRDSEPRKIRYNLQERQYEFTRNNK